MWYFKGDKIRITNHTNKSAIGGEYLVDRESTLFMSVSGKIELYVGVVDCEYGPTLFHDEIELVRRENKILRFLGI